MNLSQKIMLSGCLGRGNVRHCSYWDISHKLNLRRSAANHSKSSHPTTFSTETKSLWQGLSHALRLHQS